MKSSTIALLNKVPSIWQGRCLALLAFVIQFAGCREAPSPAATSTATAPSASGHRPIAPILLTLPSSTIITVVGNAVYAFGPSGAEAWTFVLPDSEKLTAPPIAAPNSYVYLRSRNKVHALDPEGKLVWSADIGDQEGNLQSLAALSDSSIVATTGTASLVCLSTTGAVRWTHSLTEPAKLIAEPVSAPNGFLLLRTDDGVRALNSDGEPQWNLAVPGSG